MTTTLTPAEAYTADYVFRTLIDTWVEHRRCPLPLVDRCLDLDMPLAAEAARWAATEPDRPNEQIGKYDEDRYGGRVWHGPYPGQGEHNYWWWCEGMDLTRARDVPVTNIPISCRKQNSGVSSTRGAILWLLENWTLTEDEK